MTLKGTYCAPPSSPAPALLFLHTLGKNRESWSDLAAKAQSRGFVVLAIDFRGHGESTASSRGTLRLTSFTERDYQGMVKDVAALVARAGGSRG